VKSRVTPEKGRPSPLICGWLLNLSMSDMTIYRQPSAGYMISPHGTVDTSWLSFQIPVA
jgi:hypothetical protein